MKSGVSYVLPIRRQRDDGIEELTDYLRWLARRTQLIVVDGSPPPLFAEAHERWSGFATHAAPDSDTLNGKVAGVCAGVELAVHEAIVIADDDVRYDEAALEAVCDALTRSELARPQNYFSPLPWHAAWDTARTLINRCFGADSPGTLAVRRSMFSAIGGYDGDVLYENLELIRTVHAAGGRLADLPHVYVRRLPPRTDHFWSQRARQGYDDLAQPGKLTAFLAVLPALIIAGRRRKALLTALTASALLAAERGRRLHDGRRHFPVRATMWAPIWIAERSVTVWLAVAFRITGGIPYRGHRIPTAAHGVRELRRRLRGSAGVASVAERCQTGATAAAQGNDRAAGVDPSRVDVLEFEVPPNEKGTVGIGPDRNRVAASGALRRSVIDDSHPLELPPVPSPETNTTGDGRIGKENWG